MNTKKIDSLNGTTLVVAPSRDLVASFPTGEEISALVAMTREQALKDAARFDIDTAKGRDSIISVAVTVRDKKVALTKAAKQSKVEHQDIIKEINAGAKTVEAEFQAVQDEIRKPVTDWELAETEKFEALEFAISKITAGLYSSESFACDLEVKIANITAIVIDNSFQDREFEAGERKRVVLETLGGFLAAAIKRETMEKELEERRAADAERDRLDAFEALQRQADADNVAFDKAIHDAEIQRAEDAEAERRRLEQAAKDATKLAEEQAERERVEVEEEHQRQLEFTKQAERMDAQKQREIVEADKQRAITLQETRDRDDKLRKEARAAIMGAITGLDRKQVVEALMNGEVPHVKLVL